MLTVETIGQIRREHYVARQSPRNILVWPVLLTSRKWSALRHRLEAHWLQHYHCHDRRDDVECRSNKEHDLPAAGRHLQHICERHKERCRAFGGVEKTIVSRSECAPVDIGARCRKQAIDLTPRKEHDT